ncbi:hypothetical protein [Ornithinimicrobium panacihumi]|uniref:hypothetical protein n=1 Tax=Ornithinimicrobium panacihumi TaxID=2008449 RepID=UPI003F892AE4
MRPALPLAVLSALVVTGCSSTTLERPSVDAPTTPVGAGASATPAAPHTPEVGASTAEAGGTADSSSQTRAPGVPGADVSGDPGPAAAALALVPAEAGHVTITDWARIKERLGAGDLTSESLQTDRSEFWRAVPASTVLLTDGVLRAENSRLGLRYGLTQDDARWEVRWAGDGQEVRGLALRLRDDLDLVGLQRAVDDQVPGLEGARVEAGSHLLLRDDATAEPLGATEGAIVAFAGDAESELLVPGCLSWPTALGVDATVEDQEAVVDAAPVDDLLDPSAWAMSFTGRSATVTVVYPGGTTEAEAAEDAAARVALGEAWPTTESVGWSDAFGLAPDGPAEGFAVEDRGGQLVATLDYRVVNTTAAAAVALAGLVPQGVCSQIDWLEEPTGL